MANNLAIKDGASASQTLKTTDNSGVHTPHHNVDEIAPLGATGDIAATTDGADATLIALFKRHLARITTLIGLLPATIGQKAKAASTSVTLASDDDLLVKVGEVQASPTANTVLDRLKQLLTGIVLAAGTNVIGATLGLAKTVSISYTRPADTSQYAINDAFSDSTSAPAVLAFANVFRAAGKSALLTDLIITSSANQSTALQGELWLFDTAPTPINDNAAFTLTDAEMLTVVAKIPFTMTDAGNATSGAGGNAMAYVTGLNILATGGASANLHGLVKVKNAYTPVSAEVLQFRLKAIQID